MTAYRVRVRRRLSQERSVAVEAADRNGAYAEAERMLEADEVDWAGVPVEDDDEDEVVSVREVD